jgi:uridylate kinase
MKATKVDGVYDKDPEKFDDAQKIDRLDLHDAVADNAIKVMDKAALGLASEHKLPLVVFNAMQAGNICKVAQGEAVGTLISS